MTQTPVATQTAPGSETPTEVSEPVPLRVVHVAQPTTEGVARCVSDLAKRQVASGHHVVVVCPPEGDLPRWALDAGAAFEPWVATRSPGPQVASEARRLRLLLEDAADDEVVHLHSAKAGLVGRLVLRGRRPTVFQPHAWSWLAARGAVRRGALSWERRAVRWSDRVVCVSREEARAGRAAGVDGRYEIVPNGVDLDDYPAAGPGARASARGALDLDEGPAVVCLGRLSRQKGQDVLLDAWPRVVQAVPGARLYLVGEGPDRRALEARARPGVVFAGSSPHPALWLAAADVVALPSRWEGMSMVMLEAMATGRTVVASEVPGASEALAEEAGELVPPEDPASLARALIARLRDPRLAAAEGRAGRIRAERTHSAARTAAQMERLYRAVLKERGV